MHIIAYTDHICTRLVYAACTSTPEYYSKVISVVLVKGLNRLVKCDKGCLRGVFACLNDGFHKPSEFSSHVFNSQMLDFISHVFNSQVLDFISHVFNSLIFARISSIIIYFVINNTKHFQFISVNMF